jgi:hypothetical protein
MRPPLGGFFPLGDFFPFIDAPLAFWAYMAAAAFFLPRAPIDVAPGVLVWPMCMPAPGLVLDFPGLPPPVLVKPPTGEDFFFPCGGFEPFFMPGFVPGGYLTVMATPFLDTQLPWSQKSPGSTSSVVAHPNERKAPNGGTGGSNERSCRKLDACDTRSNCKEFVNSFVRSCIRPFDLSYFTL